MTMRLTFWSMSSNRTRTMLDFLTYVFPVPDTYWETHKWSLKHMACKKVVKIKRLVEQVVGPHHNPREHKYLRIRRKKQ